MKINRNGRVLLDFLEALSFIALNGRSPSDEKSETTYYGHAGTSTIDYVWVNFEGTYVAKDFMVFNAGHFDHLPIQLTIQTIVELPTMSEHQQNNIPKTSIKWKPDQKENYEEEMRDMLKNTDVEIVSTIRKIATKINMKTTWRTSESKDKPWFDSACREQRKKLNKLYRLSCRAEGKHCRLEFPESRKQYLRTIKEAKVKLNEKAKNMLSSAKSPQEFWKDIAKYRKRTRALYPVDVKTWIDYYSKAMPPSDPEKLMFLDARHRELDKAFIDEDTRKVLKNLKTGKAPGPDGVSNEFFKNFPDNKIHRITSLINEVFENGKVPEIWASANTLVFHEKRRQIGP